MGTLKTTSQGRRYQSSLVFFWHKKTGEILALSRKLSARTSISNAVPPCLRKVHTSAQGQFFIQSEQVKRNLPLPALTFSIELAGSPKSPVGALNPQALLGHICLPCIAHFKENFLFLPLRKKSRLSSWPCVISLRMLPSVGVLQKGSCPRQVLFPSPPALHSFTTQGITRAFAVTSPVKAGGSSMLSQAFSQPVSLSVSKALRTPSQCQMSLLSCCMGFSHIWGNGCYCGQYPAKGSFTNWKLFCGWVSRGWMVSLLSCEE